MKLNVGGQIVEVDDSFASMTAEQQEATVNEIAQQLGIKGGEQAKPSLSDRLQPAVEKAASVAEPAVQATQQALENPAVQNYLATSAVAPLVGGVAPGGMQTGLLQDLARRYGGVAGEALKSGTLNNVLLNNLMKSQGVIPTAAQFTKALLGPLGEVTAPQLAKGAAGMVARGLTAPENLMLAPYQMAAAEAAKIRQNPRAPGLENQPYAQSLRGEYATQGQAGQANIRKGIINRPITGVNEQERAMLEEDRQRQMRNMVQMEAARRIKKTGGIQDY